MLGDKYANSALHIEGVAHVSSLSAITYPVKNSPAEHSACGRCYVIRSRRSGASANCSLDERRALRAPLRLLRRKSLLFTAMSALPMKAGLPLGVYEYALQHVPYGLFAGVTYAQLAFDSQLFVQV